MVEKNPVDLNIEADKFEQLADEVEDQWEKFGKPIFEEMMKGVDLRNDP